MDREKAIELVRECYPDGRHQLSEALRTLIPELKENEDERIRKGLIEHLKELKEQSVEGSHLKRPEHYDAWIAWFEKQGEKIDAIENFDTEFEKQISHLIVSAINKEHEYNQGFVKWVANTLLNYAKHELEKQSEQKPVSFKAEHGKYYYCIKDYFSGGKKQASKGDVVQALRGLPIMGLDDASEFFLPVNNIQLGIFKVGDWIVKNDGKDCFTDGSYVLQVTNVDDHCYKLSNGLYLKEPFINTYRLWTIEDAKAGDVLYTASTASNETFIFKGLTTEGNIVCYCSYDSEDKYCEGTHHFIGKPTFMTHPATKEQRDLLFQKMKEAGYEWDAEKMELKKIEQNPADNVEKNAFEWNEQDENNKDLLIDIIRRDLKLSAEEFTRLAGWLTNLQDRLNSCPKSLTHDGTKQMLDKIASYLHYKGYEDESNGMRAFINKDVIGITEFINEISEYLKTNMNGSDPEFIEKFKTFVKTLFYEKESKNLF